MNADSTSQVASLRLQSETVYAGFMSNPTLINASHPHTCRHIPFPCETGNVILPMRQQMALSPSGMGNITTFIYL